MAPNETANRLLDSAQALIQDRGYNAFSYKDLAEEIGIRTASIHYHFPAKEDLGVALMDRYTSGLDEALAGIDRNAANGKRADSPCTARLKSFFKMYAKTESCGSICVCGSLASDRETLPEALQTSVALYVQKSEAWLRKLIEEGMRSGEFDAEAGKPSEIAASILASLQGGLILARVRAARGSLLASIQRVYSGLLGI